MRSVREQEGVFQIDLPLATLRTGRQPGRFARRVRLVFCSDGAAWPYERQALVKLRPIAGDMQFGNEIVALRDRLIYTGEPFDVAAMRAMREKQLRQLVQAGTINAKLSPGHLADTEYLVQGLQITLRPSRSVAAGGQHARRARGAQNRG